MCQICGRKSGFYPLCREHFAMRDQGLIVKCVECGQWYLKSEGCSRCTESDRYHAKKGEILFLKEVIEQIGKKLYAIAQYGAKQNQTPYDLKRYDRVGAVSKDMHELWSNASQAQIAVSKEDLLSWSDELEDVAREGRRYSDDTYDIRRYAAVQETADELRQQVEADSMDLDEVPSADSASANVVFVYDREIAPRIMGMLEKASREVLVASPFIWGIKDIVEKLTELKEKNKVQVRILTRRPTDDDAQHRETLREMHVRGFSIETEDYLHAKIVLVDDREIYIGSANLVRTSMDRNLETGIWTNDRRAVSSARRYFDEAFTQAGRKRL